MTTYVVASSPSQQLTITSAFTGTFFGLLLGFFFMGVDTLCRRFNLRAFNLTLLGLFLGYLMGMAVLSLFNMALSLLSVPLDAMSVGFIQMGVLLFCAYLGVIFTLSASEELSISLPFFKFTPMSDKKRDVLVDGSVLYDSRIIDLAASGLLDHHFVIPRFVIRELYSQLEEGDEAEKSRARRSLETLKKLEALPQLGLRFDDTDVPEEKEGQEKLVRLARLLDAVIFTADFNRVQASSVEGVTVVNIHSLANALKSLMTAGEQLTIKVQRYGKEARQGVGYLEDGTMVVVNGGGDFIGESIPCQVLSVKHTSSGRMVFCNALEGEGAFSSSDSSMATRSRDKGYSQV